MTAREAFEKWAHDNGLVNLHHRAVALKAWQAATAAEREHCLAICNRNSLEWERQGSDVRAFAADQIAAAIRGQD